MFDFCDYLDFYFNALVRYVDEPCFSVALDMQHKIMDMKDALRRQEKEMEKRITANVMRNLSVRLENGGAIAEIESLREAIERLGK